ncbi:MAG: hypothetical protein AAGF89_16770, partial [Bacteroidota bacterium]
YPVPPRVRYEGNVDCYNPIKQHLLYLRPMKSKQTLGILFTIVGAIGLAVGVLSIFNKGMAFGQNPWGVAIIGGIFFLTGMGLMRTVGR